MSKPPQDKASTGQAEAPPQPEMARPGWLPEEAREMLTARMQRHGQEMMFLLINLVILRHDEAAQEAQELADEPRLGRPAPGERDTLNALLPARFFELEDELRERAAAVASAAKSRDDTRLGAAYGQLTQTCVSCHSVYLHLESTNDEDSEE